MKELSRTETPPPPAKLSSSLRGYPGYKNRNHLQTDLQILADLIIEDVIRAVEEESDFLSKCYCTSGALSQYSLLSRSILEALSSALTEQVSSDPTLTPAVTRKDIDPNILAGNLSKRPVLLAGDVGVGKTMFIRHFINVDARDLARNSVVLYIDFGSEPALARDLPRFIAEAVKVQLRENHDIDIDDYNFVRGVYFGELQRFDRSPYGLLKDVDPVGYRARQVDFLTGKMANLERFQIIRRGG